MLCNGAIGTLSAVEENVDGSVRRFLVKFDNSKAGEMARASCPQLSKKYPGCTGISPKEIEYSLSKRARDSGIQHCDLDTIPIDPCLCSDR